MLPEVLDEFLGQIDLLQYVSQLVLHFFPQTRHKSNLEHMSENRHNSIAPKIIIHCKNLILHMKVQPNRV